MTPAEWDALNEAIDLLSSAAHKEGLDPFPVHFQVVPAHVMYQIGAYGLPGRFSHWTHGKAYERMKREYDMGLSRIFELVINSNPAQAFLLEANPLLVNKLVAAHVIAHADFFKHNAYFVKTARDMEEQVRLHAERIRQYEFDHGRARVEEMLDAILAIEEQVDPWGEEEADLLLYLTHHARGLEDWERDLLAIVRTERLYFLPQAQTKIMNEGWATFWHQRLMRELPLDDQEYVDYARLNSAVQAPLLGGINPYHLGTQLWQMLAEEAGEAWRETLLELRESEDDVAFLRNHLTTERIRQLHLFAFGYHHEEWAVTDLDPEVIRETLIRSRVRGGAPHIVVADGDYRGNRELYLQHVFDGRELEVADAEKTLQYIKRIWQRAVHLETVVGGQKKVLHAE